MTSADRTDSVAQEAGLGWLDWLDARNGLLNAIQASALIVGGAWAILMLMISIHDRRVDLAMTQAAQFVDGRTGEARRLLDRLWYGKPKELMSLFREALARLPDEDARSEAIQNFVKDYILPGDDDTDPVDVQLAIADVAAQLDLIAACAGEGDDRPWLASRMVPDRCDRATVEKYFCDYTNSFHTLYGGALEEIRLMTGNHSLGTTSKKFAEGPGCAE